MRNITLKLFGRLLGALTLFVGQFASAQLCQEYFLLDSPHSVERLKLKEESKNRIFNDDRYGMRAADYAEDHIRQADLLTLQNVALEIAKKSKITEKHTKAALIGIGSSPSAFFDVLNLRKIPNAHLIPLSMPRIRLKNGELQTIGSEPVLAEMESYILREVVPLLKGKTEVTLVDYAVTGDSIYYFANHLQKVLDEKKIKANIKLIFLVNQQHVDENALLAHKKNSHNIVELIYLPNEIAWYFQEDALKIFSRYKAYVPTASKPFEENSYHERFIRMLKEALN